MAERLVVELLCEEIPVAEQLRFQEEAPRLFLSFLETARIDFEVITTHTTPRRLTLIGEGIAERQEDRETEIVGPPVDVAFAPDGSLTRAGESFLKKNGCALENTHRTEKGGRLCIAATLREVGRASVEVLAELLPQWIAKLPFARSMRWMEEPWTFSRPVRGIVALLGDVHIVFSSHGLQSTRHVYGHRFVSPEGEDVAHARGYEKLLERHAVVVDALRRRKLILDALEQVAQAENLTWIEDESLVDEVVCLVEHPTLVMGSFSQDFLEVPEAVILSAMRKHQRYFGFRHPDGRLAARFATILGTPLRKPEASLAGNQRVLSARLSDARFFWDEDRKIRLEERRIRMEKMVYHQKLGTMWDRIGRIRKMAVWFAERLGEDSSAADRAALLCKMDLETQMVYEFPDLQGEMGCAYARAQGEDPAVALAIAEHYRPRFAKDALPESTLGKVLALAEKSDTLCGGIAAGLKPTGSADPFALRRAAVGLLRILLESELNLSLTEIFTEACSALPLPCDVVAVQEFVIDRLRGLFADAYPKEMVESVLATGADRPLDVKWRLTSVADMAQTPDFVQLVRLYKRMNILKKAKCVPETIETQLLEHPSEKKLYQALMRVMHVCSELLAKKDYRGALREMVALWRDVDEFFDDERGVRVMADDERVRQNRLSLLFQLDALMRQIADFKILAALT